MDCIVTMLGDGVGRYGKPKNDRTGPVREFIVDNQYFYPRVFKHVKDCAKCDSVTILETYLNRRINKGEELVTGALVKLAYQYFRLHRCVPISLVRQFEIRAGINHNVSRANFALYELANRIIVQKPQTKLLYWR
jgi:hypothetical protein